MNQKVNGLWKKVKDASKGVESLKEKIRIGEESLGSNFDNFVFCHIGANPKSWDPFYELKDKIERVKKCENELLIVSSRTESGGLNVEYDSGLGLSYNFMPPMNFETHVHDMTYGVLTGGDLDFDLKDDEIVFPIGDKYLETSAISLFDTGFELGLFSVMDGNIRKKLVDLPHLYGSTRIENLFGLPHGSQSQILIGPEVGEYFCNISNGERVYSEIKNKFKFS